MRFSLCGPMIPEQFRFDFHLWIHWHGEDAAEKLEALKAKLNISTTDLETAVEEAPEGTPQ